MKMGRLMAMTATNAGQSEESTSGCPILRLMAVHSAKGIIRQTRQTDNNRVKLRGNSTVLRAKPPPFNISLGSKPTSLNSAPTAVWSLKAIVVQAPTTRCPSVHTVYRICTGIEHQLRTLRVVCARFQGRTRDARCG